MPASTTLNAMIFVAETETKELYVFQTVEAAVAACEGLDVEAAVWIFWDSEGNPLEPEFSVPNKRGLFSVQNGRYHLVPARTERYAPLLGALEEIRFIDGGGIFKTIEEVRAYLIRHSMRMP